jgi:RNase P subunit RPR2
VLDIETIDLSELRAQIDDIRYRTKSSVDLTRRLIDQTFIQFKVSHRTIYAAQESQERMNRLHNAADSGTRSHELSDKISQPENRLLLLEPLMNVSTLVCGHCEGILFNKKAYRVWSEDSGIILLDTIVCYSCKLDAQELGLNTDPI